jgi:hypothetical protein
VVRRADRESGLADSQALVTRTTRWLLATQARLGMTGEARALLAALDDERASSGEIRNARAVICLAEGDPAGALAAVAGVLDGRHRSSGAERIAKAVYATDGTLGGRPSPRNRAPGGHGRWLAQSPEPGDRRSP